MRAISPIARYGIQLVESIPRRGMDSTGTIVEYHEGKSIHAQFSQGGLTEWEQIAALEHFDFSGLPDGVNPLTRVSVYDTEAATAHLPEHERVEVEALLAERLEHFSKVFPSEFRIVAKPPVPTPWPSYDGDTIEKILEIQEQTGFSPEAIRLYESERPRPRTKLIQAMEALERQAAEEQFSITV